MFRYGWLLHSVISHMRPLIHVPSKWEGVLGLQRHNGVKSGPTLHNLFTKESKTPPSERQSVVLFLFLACAWSVCSTPYRRWYLIYDWLFVWGTICGKVYYIQTKHRLGTRIKEHKDACLKYHMGKSAIPEHAVQVDVTGPRRFHNEWTGPWS